MSIILQILAIVFYLIGLGCWILILIEAFKDQIWKGVVGLLCGLYLLYYAVFDFEHDNKWLIVLCGFGGTGIGAGLMALAAAQR